MPLKQRPGNVVALDIGASKISCLVGKRHDDSIQITGMGYGKSDGISSGSISNLRAVEKSIKATIDATEKSSGQKIKEVFVGLSSNILISHTTQCEIPLSDREITSKDISKLILSKTDHYLQHNISILHTFIYDYALDGNKNITSPLGLHGDLLTCTMNIVSTNINNMVNFANCLAGCGVGIKGFISSAYATGIASLNADELKLGVNLIELGAGTTSISIFRDHHMIYTDGIPIGLSHVTSDIAVVLGISQDNAERIKNLYGATEMSELDNDEIIDIEEPGMETVQVSRSMLISIIRARIDEIIEILLKHLDKNNVYLASRTVLAGGGARLHDMRSLVSRKTDTNVRIATNNAVSDMNDNLSLEFMSAYGILQHAKDISTNSSIYYRKKSSFPIWRWLQRYISK